MGLINEVVHISYITFIETKTFSSIRISFLKHSWKFSSPVVIFVYYISANVISIRKPENLAYFI